MEETYYIMFYNIGVALIAQIIAGMDSMKNSLINAGVTMMNTLYIKMYEFELKFYYVGVAIIQAIIDAIYDNADAVYRAVVDVCTSALEYARRALGITSPSKEFYKIGDYAMQGFVLGITDGGTSVEKASSSMAQKAIDSTKSAIARLADTVMNGIDTEPTIRPVLDLSNVESGTRRISAMFSRNQAMSISSGMERSPISNSDSQNGVSETSTGATYSFVQNNYSPKALSRIEIYRQTSNQFAAMVRRRATT